MTFLLAAVLLPAAPAPLPRPQPLTFGPGVYGMVWPGNELWLTLLARDGGYYAVCRGVVETGHWWYCPQTRTLHIQEWDWWRLPATPAPWRWALRLERTRDGWLAVDGYLKVPIRPAPPQ